MSMIKKEFISDDLELREFLKRKWKEIFLFAGLGDFLVWIFVYHYYPDLTLKFISHLGIMSLFSIFLVIRFLLFYNSRKGQYVCIDSDRLVVVEKSGESYPIGHFNILSKELRIDIVYGWKKVFLSYSPNRSKSIIFSTLEGFNEFLGVLSEEGITQKEFRNIC